MNRCRARTIADHGPFRPLVGVFCFALLASAAPGNAQEAPVLRLLAPDVFLPGTAVPVAVSIETPAGHPDRGVWDAVVSLECDNGAVAVTPDAISLVNGRGSAAVTAAAEGDMTLTVRWSGQSASRSIRSGAEDPVTWQGGPLAGSNTVWSGLVRVTNTVTVGAGQSLTISEGALVLIDGVTGGTGGIRIDVTGGQLHSLGTAARPVTLTAYPAGTDWGGIRHSAAAPSSYRHTFLTRAGRTTGVGHTGTGPLLRLSGSTVVMEDCIASDIVGKVMYASSGSDITLRRSLFARARMGPETVGSAFLAEWCWFMEMRGPDDSDGIYLHRQPDGRQIRLVDVVVAGGDDDGIDTLRADADIERAIVRDFADKGVSVFGGRVTLNNCLVTGHGIGVSAKEVDANVARILMAHCTIAGNSVGIAATDKFAEPNARVLFSLTNCVVEAGTNADDPISTDYDPADISICFSALGEPWPGEGNIEADPLFLAPARGNYRLRSGSPCLGAATNLAWAAAGTDLDGAPRLSGASPDIGCYEADRLVADFTAAPRSGESPLTVVFTPTAGGADTGGLACLWDFDGDGQFDLTNVLGAVSHVYTNEGVYDVRMAVTNAAGETSAAFADRFVTVIALIAVRYVSPGGSHSAPYATWATAATNIQDALDAADDDSLVLVAPGAYALPATVTLSKPVTLRGADGADATILDGGGAVRCLTLAHENAVVEGITIRNGRARRGAGALIEGAGVLRDCVLRDNVAAGGGSDSDGGGVYGNGGGTLERCVIVNNQCDDDGGGVQLYYGGAMRDCLVAVNTAGDKGGGVYVRVSGELAHCTIVGNEAGSGGGVYLRDGGALRGCILHDNAPQSVTTIGSGQSYAWTCAPSLLPGEGNLAADPGFDGAPAAPYRLADTSVCIDAVAVAPYSILDLERVPRPLDGDADGVAAADMGCYEFVSSAADTDGDRVSDRDEQLAGTDPTNPTDLFAVSDLRFASPGVAVIAWIGNAGRSYSLLEASTPYGTWTDVPGFTNAPGAEVGMAFTNVPAPAATGFLRLRVDPL